MISVLGEVDRAARPLQVYVPRLAAEWLSEHPKLSHLALDATMAFADISGFTALTERLPARERSARRRSATS